MSKGKATRTRATAAAEWTKTKKPRWLSKPKAKRKNKPQPTERRLTVSRLHPTGTDMSRETTVPFVRLSGHWMKQAGFCEGDQILVQIEPERLVLTPVPALPAPPATTDWASER